MIWLSIVSLVAGALLAQRFKIIALVPATLVNFLMLDRNATWRFPEESRPR
jgi:hypothetical protein